MEKYYDADMAFLWGIAFSARNDIKLVESRIGVDEKQATGPVVAFYFVSI